MQKVHLERENNASIKHIITDRRTQHYVMTTIIPEMIEEVEKESNS